MQTHYSVSQQFQLHSWQPSTNTLASSSLIAVVRSLAIIITEKKKKEHETRSFYSVRSSLSCATVRLGRRLVVEVLSVMWLDVELRWPQLQPLIHHRDWLRWIFPPLTDPWQACQASACKTTHKQFVNWRISKVADFPHLVVVYVPMLLQENEKCTMRTASEREKRKLFFELFMSYERPQKNVRVT